MCYGNPDVDCTNEEIEEHRRIWKEYYSEKARMRSILDSATVEAYDSATVEAYDSAKVEAYDSAKVELKSDYATVLCHGKIFVTEKAIVIRASVVKAAEV